MRCVHIHSPLPPFHARFLRIRVSSQATKSHMSNRGGGAENMTDREHDKQDYEDKNKNGIRKVWRFPSRDD